MQTMTAAQAEQQLAALAEQFAQWRQQRTYRFAPFPRPLWEQAIALTAVLPLATVAKGLQLRGRDLQKRCATRPEIPGVANTQPPVGFVEVPTASAWPLSGPATEIEVHRADGARLWIRSHEPQFPLAAVVRTFLERP